jgi:hypothetical protein
MQTLVNFISYHRTHHDSRKSTDRLPLIDFTKGQNKSYYSKVNILFAESASETCGISYFFFNKYIDNSGAKSDS